MFVVCIVPSIYLTNQDFNGRFQIFLVTWTISQALRTASSDDELAFRQKLDLGYKKLQVLFGAWKFQVTLFLDVEVVRSKV